MSSTLATAQMLARPTGRAGGGVDARASGRCSAASLTPRGAAAAAAAGTHHPMSSSSTCAGVKTTSASMMIVSRQAAGSATGSAVGGHQQHSRLTAGGGKHNALASSSSPGGAARRRGGSSLARRMNNVVVKAEAAEALSGGSGGGSGSSGGAGKGKASSKVGLVVGLLLACAAGAACWVLSANTAMGQAAVAALAKSGFTAAFALIFVSEIGDKTFFIAALLAMRLGRITVLAGATSALGIMTVISVVIGRVAQQIPASLTTSLPVGEYLAVALLLFFGVRTLKEALEVPESKGGDESREPGELEAAAEVVQQAEAKGSAAAARAKGNGKGAGKGAGGRFNGWLAAFWETFTLIFIAEWGDRSMLATIALGAAQNPVGVAMGATLGHFVATLIAVVGGSLMSKRISERSVGICGGVLFIVFAFATLAGVF
eukprot:CAMPEP_0197616260 /NCGR_PEP_ID=MMETSP1326-20131121/60440_1 /TAXON_ID=1155430 /ORGANISM="Genus nov. species nov., Strain RCC2288" /LENGTH=430 /DNA_ID=CAMNT_0043185147 /DNA_START=134 /DNA_END=1426 /DNA_ORIENTATION=+